MGYDADQYDENFRIKAGREEDARKAVLKSKELKGQFTSTTTLQDMFMEFGWDGPKDLQRSYSKIIGTTHAFLCAIAPFVEDGSHITMIGEDLAIWRWYFEDGKCEEQNGIIAFPKSGISTKRGKQASKVATPPGIDIGEAFLDTVDGEKLVFSSYSADPEGASYVRVVDARGVELVMWDCKEWEDDPVGVMGAILGAIVGGAAGR